MGSLPILASNLSVDTFDNFSNYQMVEFIAKIAGNEACKTTLKTDVLKKLKTTKKKYDIIITEIFGTDCMLGFAHLFQIPVVSLISSVNLPWASERIGNPDNPSYIPNYFEAFLPKMSLFERVQNTLSLIHAKYWYFRFYIYF